MYYRATDDELRTLINAGFRVNSPSRGLRALLPSGNTRPNWPSRRAYARIFSIGRHNSAKRVIVTQRESEG